MYKYNPLLHILYVTLLTLAILTPQHARCAESLLSQGRWIKVHADTTAVYRIPNTLLAEWGFSDPENIIIGGYGSVERAHTLNTAPDDIPILPVYRDKEAIYFYAEGDMRLTLTHAPDTYSSTPFITHYNYYSAGSCYFIGERPELASPAIEDSHINATANATEIDTHYSPSHRVYRENHPSTHGLLSYSNHINASSPRTIDFDITDQAGSGSLYYSYIWRHAQDSPQSIGVRFSDNVVNVGGSADRLSQNSTISHRLYSHKEQARFLLDFPEDAKNFSVSFSNPADLFSTLALSNHTFIYKRLNRISLRPSTLYFPGLPENAAIRLQGSIPGIMAWDVSEPRNPINLPIHLSDSGNGTIYPQSRAQSVKIHTFVPSADLPAPRYMGEVLNQDIHSTDGADLLIVTTEATYAPALRLAAAHERWQGLKVCVVKQSQVFNEFSSGALHPNGLRHFVKHLASASAHPLRYLLLFGPGTWDSRATFDHSGIEHMVLYSTESVSEQCDDTKFYCSDLYFGTLADHIGTSLASMRENVDISVGRVPAPDTAAAEAYVDKCITYLSDPVKAGHFNHAIISGGIGDASQHLTASENIGDIIKNLTHSPTLNRAHLSLFALSSPQLVESKQLYTYLDSRLGGDARLFSYTGHSSRGLISNTMHNIRREEGMIYGSLPVVYMSSCSTTPIDISDKSLGVTMILHNPGPIAVIGAGDEVYLNYNMNLNSQYVKLFYSPDGGECLGDVFRIAVNSTKPSTSQYANNLSYNFLGDPALPRYLPQASVNVTSIGTANVNEADKVSIPSLSRTHIAGTITRPDGSVDTSFSGKLYIDIYDTPYGRTTLKHNSSDLAKELTIDEDLLYSSTADVHDGLWETYLTLPPSTRTGTNRMTLNAVSSERIIASGGNEYFSIVQPAAEDLPDNDTTPPAIRVWLDTPGSSDGALVSPSPTLYIEITDTESGTSLNTSAIGMAPKVLLDETSLPAATGLIHSEDNGIARGTYPLSNLADGHHNITVHARDIAGNTASETINFTVVTADKTAMLNVSSPIVREEVTFTLSHSLPIDTRSQRLVIRDMNGRTVLSADTSTFPYTWDFTGIDGEKVPDGTYRASVIIDAKPYYTATPETAFTIVKKQ